MSAAEVSWVPLHSSPEAVFKTDGRNIFQALLSKADVRQRMRDIAGTSRRVMGRAVKSNDLLQHLVRSVQGMADSCGNVEHLARNFPGRGLGREQVGLDGVVHISKVPALLAVAEDGRGFALQHLCDELGKHCRVL